jgi:hypothetical protein
LDGSVPSPARDVVDLGQSRPADSYFSMFPGKRKFLQTFPAIGRKRRQARDEKGLIVAVFPSFFL